MVYLRTSAGRQLVAGLAKKAQKQGLDLYVTQVYRINLSILLAADTLRSRVVATYSHASLVVLLSSRSYMALSSPLIMGGLYPE